MVTAEITVYSVFLLPTEFRTHVDAVNPCRHFVTSS